VSIAPSCCYDRWRRNAPLRIPCPGPRQSRAFGDRFRQTPAGESTHCTALHCTALHCCVSSFGHRAHPSAHPSDARRSDTCMPLIVAQFALSSSAPRARRMPLACGAIDMRCSSRNTKRRRADRLALTRTSVRSIMNSAPPMLSIPCTHMVPVADWPRQATGKTTTCNMQQTTDNGASYGLLTGPRRPVTHPFHRRRAMQHGTGQHTTCGARGFQRAGAAPRALESPICRNTCESRFGRRASRRSLRVDRSPSTCRGRRPAGVSTRVEGSGRAALASPCGAKCKAACARCCASCHAVWDTTPGGIIDYQCHAGYDARRYHPKAWSVMTEFAAAVCSACACDSCGAAMPCSCRGALPKLPTCFPPAWHPTQHGIARSSMASHAAGLVTKELPQRPVRCSERRLRSVRPPCRSMRR
jgi:hypothetical protein